MAMTREEACRVLELHRDATGEEIRASYKRLALRWHPDKHNNSPDSTKKFQEISSAYKRLTSNESSDDIHLTRADMFDIFAHVFFHRNGMFDFNRYNPSESDEDYSDDEEDDMEDELLHSIATRLRNKYDRSKTTNCTKANEKPAHHLSESEALKNAEELIEEEEKERKKAEKRRQKKKRSKEKRRQKEKKDEKENEKDNKKENDKEKTNIQFEKQRLKENQNMSNKPPQNVKISKSNHSSSTPGVKEKTQNTSNSNKKEHQKSNDNKKNHVNGDSDSDGEEPDWDQSSAFFARAAGRNPPPDPSNSALNTLKEISKSNTVSSSNTADTQSNKNNEKEAVSEQLDPVVLQSRQLAVRGNEMANLGNYPAAIELFTQAIKLDARDFRFFGNRSYCYDRLGQYEKALQDADVAISLAPDWPKGYFRRGRALAGIKLFSDSEVAFAQVLKLDKQCEDAIFELTRVRVQQLEDMGFPTTQSEAAINSFGTVQAALEALLAGKVIYNTEEIYVSDGEEVEDTRVSQNLAPVLQTLGGCKSVWVGNVNAEVVSEDELQKIFSQCGKIESVKVLPTRYCAFINYSTPEAAARAISVLQAFELGGQNLLLRYPNNSGVPTSLQPQTNESFSKPKLTGPVNGDECYFWRTTGCSFGDRCRNRHTPESKGIDLKKVEAKYGGKF